MSQLTVAGLFAGIGGFELGLRRARHEIKFLCEIDPGARAVLKSKFPRADLRSDVREIDDLPAHITLLTSGFPCQDLSQVGERNGIKGENSGLVRHVFRLLKKRRIPWVLIENVPFMLQLDRGAAIGFVTAELERLGYRWAYRVIDARAFGLPQRRERVFLLASTESDPARILFASDEQCACDILSDGNPYGFYWTEGNRGLGWAYDAIPTLKGGSLLGIPSPPAIWFQDGRIGKPDIRDAERLQGFPENWTRRAADRGRASGRWRFIGNAVTVDIAEWIGKLLRSRQEATVQLTPLARTDAWPKAACGDGENRYAANAGSWPVHRESPGLRKFLRYPVTPLSLKATFGFTCRLAASCLDYPSEFMAALEHHIEQQAAATNLDKIPKTR